MSRLIDADNYCENICKCNRESCDKENCPIHMTQTAYDVDKVVEQVKEIGSRFCILKHCTGIYSECDHGAVMKAIISKIKAGGVHE